MPSTLLVRSVVLILFIIIALLLFKKNRRERKEMQQRTAERDWLMLEELAQSEDENVRNTALKSMERIKAEQAAAEAKRQAKAAKKQKN